jgi:hypothetical protein
MLQLHIVHEKIPIYRDGCILGCCAFLVKANAPMMKAASTSDTLVNFYRITRPYNPEYSQLHTHHRENLKSHKMYIYIWGFRISNSVWGQLLFLALQANVKTLP